MVIPLGLFNFQTLELQAVIRLHSQVAPAASRANQHLGNQQLHICQTVVTPALCLLFEQVQFAAFGQGTATNHVETEPQRFRLHAGKCANLKPYGGNAPGMILPGVLLHDVHRMMAQGYFMHLASVVRRLMAEASASAITVPR
jgi:hypothetical protein